MDIETVEVGGTIRLGQFLKFAGLADSGAHAHELIAEGDVQVDGRVETRRGRQLHGGEVVTLADGRAVRTVRVG
ncbi:RNA-binding S4 domain-containing protein [Brooklawnia cerclae]|uniref:Ribosome-associated protein n=1 Tax=Brooklawnia cerclae TaxID=349934 RepID=A0ABX0SBN9_9ACTN|nr:RNA-binding S4 domain-containing protein [Brooklawnia cerclae]NIH55805.1 ribosome-associated protein [Brooklawnia cerclae]